MGNNIEKETVCEVVTVADKLWDLVRKEISTDCIMNITNKDGTKKTFKLHKIMLVTSSPVFERMLETDMKEGRTGVIDINDIESPIMELALKHMYSCVLDKGLTTDAIKELLRVADKYQIDTLLEVCSQYAYNHLMDPANILFLLNLIPNFKDSVHAKTILHGELLKVFASKTFECIKGDDKLEISEDTLLMILKLDSLYLCSELDLIKFVDRWAVAKIKNVTNEKHVEDNLIRELIFPNVLPLLRFLTLYRREILEFSTCNWLTRFEKEQILKPTDDFPEYLSKNTENRCCKPDPDPLMIFMHRKRRSYK